MLIPEFFFGKYQHVKKECRKIITKLKKGKSWGEATSANMINTKDYPDSLFIMDGPNPLLGGKEHFNMYVLFRQLHEYEPSFIRSQDPNNPNKLIYHADITDTIFFEALKTNWGTLALMGEGTIGVMFDDELKYRSKFFIQAVLKFWDDYVAEGKKFEEITYGKDYIWNCFNPFIWYSLFDLGVAYEEYTPNQNPFLPKNKEEILELLKKYNIEL